MVELKTFKTLLSLLHPSEKVSSPLVQVQNIVLEVDLSSHVLKAN